MRSLAEWFGERYRDRPGAAPAIALYLCAYAAFTIVLMAIGLVVTETPSIRKPLASFDRDVVQWFAEVHGPVLDTVLITFSTLVDTWTVVGVLIGSLSLLLAARRWHQATVLAVAPGVELSVFLTVTFLVARPRPDIAMGMVPITGSFPSGHAAMAVALYGGLAIVVASSTDVRAVKRGAYVAAGVIAVGVGLSRLYFGLHYLSDVLMGYVLGTAALAVGVIAARSVSVRAEREAAEPTVRYQPGLKRRVLTAGVALVVALAAWGVIVEPRVLLTVQHEEAEIADLPQSWEGETIGVLSDLQVGMWLDNVGMVRRAVARLVEEDPAAVLILGDFVYGEADTDQDVTVAVEVVSALPDAGIRTIAVLGNHDHASGATPELRRRLEDAGVEVLDNESVELAGNGDEGLHVAGISPIVAGAKPAEALADIPDGAPRVVMMHNPSSFDRLPSSSAPLAVAGHTHGGQVRVPFMPEWSYLRLVQDDPAAVAGWIDGYGAAGNHLFVNRGIGMSLLPIRFNCTPAITLFTLRSGG